MTPPARAAALLALCLLSAQPCAGLHAGGPASMAGDSASSPVLAGTVFRHRWSSPVLHEFTPDGQTLDLWHDLLTIHLHPAANDAAALANLAAAVRERHRAQGEVLEARTLPVTDGRPAGHLVVAVRDTGELAEAAFSRVVLIDGIGHVIVYAHRAYGDPAAETIEAWLEGNRDRIAEALMDWQTIPSVSTLQALVPAPTP